MGDMKLNSRSLLLFATLLLGLLAVVLLLVLTEKLLTIWHYLQQYPLWLLSFYGLLLLVLGCLPMWLWFKFNRTKSTKNKPSRSPFELDEKQLQQEIIVQQQRGVAVEDAQAELDELQRRRDGGLFHLALFGDASSGKSSLIKALLPEQAIDIDVIRGSTQQIEHYQYGHLMLVDMPGFNAVGQAALTTDIIEESQRADVVVFLLTGDLSRTEMELFETLCQLHRPMVLALNKSDLYSEQQLQQIQQAIEQKISRQHPVVSINSGGLQRVRVQRKSGEIEQQQRTISPKIEPLLTAIERVIENNEDALRRFREVGFLLLADKKLKHAGDVYNHQQADKIIQSHTKKAIVGALASIAPGSDLVIQGAIGTQLVRSLCKLYQVPAGEIQIDEVLKATGGKLKTSTSLVLALAGNALKSFPGMGTAAGGIMHAVAYGLIFNALGRAIAKTLAELGRLDSGQTEKNFEELLSGSSQNLAKDLAKMAFKLSRK